MSKPLLLSFLGRAGAGKSTAAEYVRDEFKARMFSFAQPIKFLAQDLWEFTHEQIYGTQAEKEAIDPRYGISPRDALIRLGSGARNLLWKNIWVDVLFKKLKESHAKNPARLYVIQDNRYDNEAQAITESKDFHGYVIKLVCPNSDSPPIPSESSVDDVHPEYIYETIESCKSPHSLDLKTKVHNVVQKILHNEQTIFAKD